jgi:hypothetical protein
LSNLNYTLVSESKLTIDKAPVIILNVEVLCDTQISPWCNCGQMSDSSFIPNNKKSSKPSNSKNRLNSGSNKSIKKKGRVRE